MFNMLKSSTISTDDLYELKRQSITEGHGPVKIKKYQLKIEGNYEIAQKKFQDILRNINLCVPGSLGKYKSPTDDLKLERGKRLLVHLAGPYNAPIVIEEVSANYFRFGTLDHHQEAGFIEFFLTESNGNALFRIRSTTRAGDHLFNIAFNYLSIGSKIQDMMWEGFLKNFDKLVKEEVTTTSILKTFKEEIPYQDYHPRSYFLMNMPAS